jgi:transposase-like protein
MFMVICENCGSDNAVRKGFRHNASGKKQKFYCHDCEKWFVHDDGFKRMRTNPKHIARALHEYGDGASLKKVKEHLAQHDGIKISRWAVRKWIVKYPKLIKKTNRNSALQRLRGASTSMRNTQE